MIWTLLAILAMVLALIPASMVLVNLFYFCRAPLAGESTATTNATSTPDSRAISVLIPARNEEQSIEHCVRSVLASKGVTLQVIVLDDRSTDRTAAIIKRIAKEDDRVQLEESPSLPHGWCGKQHACHLLAQLAKYDRLLWLDADVRLTDDALIRTSMFMDQSKASSISGFPRQVCLSLAEALAVPLIHLVLLGYLPLGQMRKSASPAYAAGCGQMFMTDRKAYQSIGGHQVIRASLHDGLTLPRAFREQGLHTDLFDAHDIASCRMYHDLPSVWHGFTKNATEGMATSVGIWVWTVLLLGGHVLPWVMLLVLAGLADMYQLNALPAAYICTLLACGFSLLANALIWHRFKQQLTSLLLRPVSIIFLLLIQWYARTRKWHGQPVQWRGRNYVP